MAAIEEQREDEELPHRHEFFTIIWVIQARGIHELDFKKHVLEDDTLYFISPEQLHLLTVNSPPQGSVISFTSDFIYELGLQKSVLDEYDLFFNCNTVAPIKVLAEHKTDLESLLLRMKKELVEEHVFRNQMLITLLKAFLIICSRMKLHQMGTSPILHTRQAELVRAFKSLLEQNFSKKHQVKFYAEYLGVSPNYLNEVIHQETGSSAKALIQDRIILEARRLAFYSRESLKTIAFKLGYQDPAYFGKFFKQCVGQSFSDFRASLVEKD